MDSVLDYARNNFPVITFQEGGGFSWNARGVVVTYPRDHDDETTFTHGLFHEISHAILKHETFRHDIDLLKKERDAWSHARGLLKAFGTMVSHDHIEDCLDTYRDWIYARASCPRCKLVGVQSDKHHYSCPHCVITWKVPSSRLCAVKRKVIA